MIRKTYILALFIGINICAKAQVPVGDSAAPAIKPFVISYSLSIDTKDREGLPESYNGAIKTLFIENDRVRSRLVSLMRVQSIFYNQKMAPSITIVKESGTNQYKKVLNASQWQKMNEQYDGVRYEFIEDSIDVKGYQCKKVNILLKDGKQITAYYTNEIQHPLFSKVEPAFAGVPGIVLQYEYSSSKATFLYKASDISFNPISPDIYKIP
ncbi:MAG: hypothetical protein QM687_11485 [Ferruginibacter sp.]